MRNGLVSLFAFFELMRRRRRRRRRRR